MALMIGFFQTRRVVLKGDYQNTRINMLAYTPLEYD